MKKLLFLPLLVSSVFAQQIVHERKLVDHKFAPIGCGLERFSVATFDYEFSKVGGSLSMSRNRSMAAIWKTSAPSCLKKYGVVQFIRGCIYSIVRDPVTGKIEKSFGYSRQSRGQYIRFQHKNWEVDSIDIDPLYSSYSEPDADAQNRFNWLKWAKVPLLLNSDDASLAKDQRVFFNITNYDYLMNLTQPVSQTFVSDTPTGSSYKPDGSFGKEWVTQSSLEFKTCLYHIKDIPVMGDPESFEILESEGGPIKCVDWSNKTEPDYASQRFIRTDVLDPYCLQ